MSRTMSRPFSALLSARTPRHTRKPSSQRRSHRLWALEGLEDRLLLAATIYTVDAITDTGAGSGTSGDLLYCIDQANGNSNPDGSLIEFDPTVFGTPQTITLSSTLTLSETAGPEVISGPGANLLTVSGNNSVGVFSVSGGVTATISGQTISNGSALNGGGIFNSGTLTVSGSAIADDSAYYYGLVGGGGIYNDGTLTVSNSTLTQDSCNVAAGGGLYNDGTLTVSDSTVANNSASSWFGGGIYSDGTLTVSDSTIADNAASDGDGIWNDGTVTVSNSTIADNAGGFAGGGIYNQGTVTVSSSTIADNLASFGGGIFNDDALTISNSTVAVNSAGPYGGGGIANYGQLTAVSDTIADNTVASDAAGGGLRDISAGTAILDNTIVALNTRGSGSGATPDDISLLYGGVVSSSSAYNLIGTGGSGGLVNGVNGNQVGVADPGLDPNGLQANGGPTQTIALLPGSPAIDAGSNALAIDPTTGLPLAYDQRGPGFPRIVNGTVDIGAFEYQGPFFVVTAQPPASVTAGSDFGLTVTAENASGGVDTSFNGTVTVALSNNPGGGTLGGTLTATAQDGVATFSDLTLDQAGSGYTLLVSASGVNSATTDAFDVTPAAASQLLVTAQTPSPVLTGSTFGLVVTAEDPYGNVATSFGGSVAVALSNNPGNATLGGTLSVTPQDGVATFSDLTINQPGIGFTLKVSSSGLTGATTDPFTVQTTVNSSVGVTWGTSGSATLQTASDGLRLLPAGRNTDLPGSESTSSRLPSPRPRRWPPVMSPSVAPSAPTTGR